MSETAAQHTRGTWCGTTGCAREAGRVEIQCESIPKDRRCLRSDVPGAVLGVTYHALS